MHVANHKIDASQTFSNSLHLPTFPTLRHEVTNHIATQCCQPFGKTVEIQSEIRLRIGHFYSNAIEAPLVPSRYLRSKMPPEVRVRSNFTVVSRIYITLPHRCTWFPSCGFEASFKDVPNVVLGGNWDRLDVKVFFLLSRFRVC